jgi:hypothetical protein
MGSMSGHWQDRDDSHSICYEYLCDVYVPLGLDQIYRTWMAMLNHSYHLVTEFLASSTRKLLRIVWTTQSWLGQTKSLGLLWLPSTTSVFGDPFNYFPWYPGLSRNVWTTALPYVLFEHCDMMSRAFGHPNWSNCFWLYHPVIFLTKWSCHCSSGDWWKLMLFSVDTVVNIWCCLITLPHL